MDKSIIQFGDVFRYREKDYVFLAQTDEIIYAALIINQDHLQQIQRLSDKRESANSPKKKHPLFSVVVLKTKSFEGRGAHFVGTDSINHQTSRFEIINTLNQEDKLNIKQEIVDEDSVVPTGLIDLVRDLNL